MIKALSTALLALVLTACQSVPTSSSSQKGDASAGSGSSEPFASTYSAPTAPDYLIQDARMLDGVGGEYQDIDVLLSNGKIVQIGTDLPSSEELIVVDGRDKWLTPGIIDVHSHMGVYPSLDIPSLSDGNEAVAPSTAGVWAEHSVWPQDPTFEKAIAGGVTTVQILPGSANLFGGRGVTLKVVPSVTMMGMKFPDAPHSLKMACGENPKRVYGDQGGPSTRMGNMQGYREKWIAARDYKASWDAYKKGGSSAVKPTRDLELETLMGVLNGEINIHNHCYRADEMANMIELAKEFDYEIAAFHHAVEAYKIGDLLAENDVCGVVWADWWGFKQEAYDMVRENAALLDMVGACAIIHSDDEIQIQRLPQEVAKVISASNKMGHPMSEAKAIAWLTSNAAKSLGLEDRIGSIETGKNADVVLWDGNPFSVYTKASKVWIDGALRFDRDNKSLWRTSDFNIGILTPAGDRP